jgi:chorismate mutase
VRSFFTAQIEAARQVQQADFDRWHAAGRERVRAGADLASLRKQIDRLNDELLDALGEAGPFPVQPRAREAVERRAAELLDGEGIDATVRALAIAPLL